MNEPVKTDSGSIAPPARAKVLVTDSHLAAAWKEAQDNYRVTAQGGNLGHTLQAWKRLEALDNMSHKYGFHRRVNSYVNDEREAGGDISMYEKFNMAYARRNTPRGLDIDELVRTGSAANLIAGGAPKHAAEQAELFLSNPDAAPKGDGYRFVIGQSGGDRFQMEQNVGTFDAIHAELTGGNVSAKLGAPERVRVAKQIFSIGRVFNTFDPSQLVGIANTMGEKFAKGITSERVRAGTDGITSGEGYRTPDAVGMGKAVEVLATLAGSPAAQQRASTIVSMVRDGGAVGHIKEGSSPAQVSSGFIEAAGSLETRINALQRSGMSPDEINRIMPDLTTHSLMKTGSFSFDPVEAKKAGATVGGITSEAAATLAAYNDPTNAGLLASATLSHLSPEDRGLRVEAQLALPQFEQVTPENKQLAKQYHATVAANAPPAGEPDVGDLGRGNARAQFLFDDTEAKMLASSNEEASKKAALITMIPDPVTGEVGSGLVDKLDSMYPSSTQSGGPVTAASRDDKEVSPLAKALFYEQARYGKQIKSDGGEDVAAFVESFKGRGVVLGTKINRALARVPDADANVKAEVVGRIEVEFLGTKVPLGSIFSDDELLQFGKVTPGMAESGPDSAKLFAAVDRAIGAGVFDLSLAAGDKLVLTRAGNKAYRDIVAPTRSLTLPSVVRGDPDVVIDPRIHSKEEAYLRGYAYLQHMRGDSFDASLANTRKLYEKSMTRQAAADNFAKITGMPVEEFVQLPAKYTVNGQVVTGRSPMSAVDAAHVLKAFDLGTSLVDSVIESGGYPINKLTASARTTKESTPEEQEKLRLENENLRSLMRHRELEAARRSRQQAASEANTTIDNALSTARLDANGVPVYADLEAAHAANQSLVGGK